MKVGDLVRFYSYHRSRQRGCLPAVESHDWGFGLVQEVCKDRHGREDGDVRVLWGALNDIVLVDGRLLEVVSESR